MGQSTRKSLDDSFHQLPVTSKPGEMILQVCLIKFMELCLLCHGMVDGHQPLLLMLQSDRVSFCILEAPLWMEDFLPPSQFLSKTLVFSLLVPVASDDFRTEPSLGSLFEVHAHQPPSTHRSVLPGHGYPFIMGIEFLPRKAGVQS